MNRQALIDADAPSAAVCTGMLRHSWVGNIDLKTIRDAIGTPVFIYSEEQLVRNVRRILDAADAAGLGRRVELYIPFFPNSNPHILKPLQKLGAGLLLQLPTEYALLSRFGFDRFIISPGHISDEEISFWGSTGFPIFLSSLDEIEYVLRQAPNASVNVRFDSLGSAKPGIKFSQLKSLADLLSRYGRRLNCLEVYCGSGNSIDGMINALEQIFMVFKTYFPDAKSINFAGGHGFSYSEWNEAGKHFDWEHYFRQLRHIADHFGVPDDVKFLFEPARDVLGDIGVLLLGVQRGLIANPGNRQILTDGSRALMPSAQLRDRQHHVIFLDSALKEIVDQDARGGVRAALRGRSILRNDYVLPGEVAVPPGVGADGHVLIFDVGAYCATQHMEFLNVPPAPEVLVDSAGIAHLITSPGNQFDKWRYLLEDKRELTVPFTQSELESRVLSL